MLLEVKEYDGYIFDFTFTTHSNRREVKGFEYALSQLSRREFPDNYERINSQCPWHFTNIGWCNCSNPDQSHPYIKLK